MSNKLKLAIGLVAASVAASAHAAAEKGLSVTVGGVLDTQMGHVTQSNQYKYIDNDTTKGKYENKGLVNDAKINVSVEGKAHGLTYGGLVVVNADSSDKKFAFTKDQSGAARSKYNRAVAQQTMVFAESAFGRLEAGAYTGAYEAMKAGAAARATGGINGDWQYWASHELAGATGQFITTPNLPTASDRNVTANASKITYYTPSFAGIKAGFTYIPDAGRTGTVTTMKSVAEDLGQRNNYKDIVQGGLHYQGKFDKMGFKASALGEFGKAKKNVISATSNKKFHDLKAWEVGMSMQYHCFSIGGSYGDWGKSGIQKSNTVSNVETKYTGAKAGKYWTAGAAYEHGHYGVSFGYMSSKNGGFKRASNTYDPKKGNVELYSVGVDYKVAPGFMPYAEYTHFDIKSKADVSGSTYAKNKGHVILLGTKLVF
jgi:hypothetical protein